MNRGAGQQEVTLQALLDAAQASDVDVLVVAAADDPASTAADLDAATRESPGLVFVSADDDRAVTHAEAWACEQVRWLVLTAPPAGNAVLAPVSTLASAPLPGSWHGGRRPLPPVASLSARAALVDTQRNEADRLRAELLEERAWVAAEAERLRASQSWRVGHRVVRTARLLTFRRDRGTDALGRLIERMTAPRDP